MKIPYKIKLVKLLIKDDERFDFSEGDDLNGIKCVTIWWKG